VASIYLADPLRLELTVPEAQIGALKQDMPVTFQVATFGEETFTGTVMYISPNVRQTSRDLVVEAVAASQGKLRPGMFVTAKLLIGERPLPTVPSTALKRDGISGRVFAVVDGRANERIVQPGEEKDGLIAIASGIKTGDPVVRAPGPDVKDGVRIQ